jgi:hypothetical protein
MPYSFRMIERWHPALGLALCAAACGGSGAFHDRIFDDGVVRYRVGALVPGFERVDVGDNDLAWHDRDLGTISVNATCSDYDDVPTSALMNQLLFGTTERAFRLEETATLDGRAARHAIVDVEMDGVPVRLNVYLMRKDGCVYDLTHVGAPAQAARAQPLFDAFVHEFAVLATRTPNPKN